MSRLSSIYRSGSGRKIIVGKDEFPILDVREISICLQTCEFLVTEELISKPTASFIKSVFEQFLDAFMAVPVDIIDKKVKTLINRENSINKSAQDLEIAQDVEADDTNNTLYLLILFRTSYVFLQTCGVYDFTLLDLMRPESHRIRRILSAVVNYARFREEHSKECEDLVNNSDGNIAEIKRLQGINAKITNDISELNHLLQQGIVLNNEKTSLKQLNSFNHKLESELKSLQRNQQILTLEHSQYKEEKQRLIEKLEDHHYLNLESNKELENLKSYLSTDPEILKKIIFDLQSNLNEYQSSLSTLEASYKNKIGTIESIQTIEQELKNLFRILEEILNDLNKSDAAIDKLNKYQEFLEQQKIQLSDLNRQIQQVKRQIANIEDKIEKTKNQSAERDKNSRETLTKLTQSYEQLIEQRKIKEQELDKKKDMTLNLEKQMAVKKNQFQNEVRNAELAVSRLTSHLKLYLTEMESKI